MEAVWSHKTTHLQDDASTRGSFVRKTPARQQQRQAFASENPHGGHPPALPGMIVLAGKHSRSSQASGVKGSPLSRGELRQDPFIGSSRSSFVSSLENFRRCCLRLFAGGLGG
ncbi:hypothetical protein E4U21_006369 [Claviceps maximensis]|nr:hypothetical protein E4U21_006369 [Claviceps maximensis]